MGGIIIFLVGALVGGGVVKWRMEKQQEEGQQAGSASVEVKISESESKGEDSNPSDS